MAKSIQLAQQSTVPLPDISSLKLVVQAVNAQDMPDKIFIKQRIRNFAKGTFDDTFVAVCTPTQLEDFPEDSPNSETSYYRTNRIELIGRTAEVLRSVFDSIKYEVKKLVIDLNDMDTLDTAHVYNISAQGPICVAASAPTITSVTSELSSLTVFFLPPASNGGSAIINYQYQLFNGGDWFDRVPGNKVSPIQLLGLVPGLEYTVSLRAITSFGFGLVSNSETVSTLTP